MIEEQRKRQSSRNSKKGIWNSSLERLYDAAHKLPLEEKALLIKKLIDTSEMSLSLRVELTGASKMTVLNFNLDTRDEIAQTLEVAASKLQEESLQQNRSNKKEG